MKLSTNRSQVGLDGHTSLARGYFIFSSHRLSLGSSWHFTMCLPRTMHTRLSLTFPRWLVRAFLFVAFMPMAPVRSSSCFSSIFHRLCCMAPIKGGANFFGCQAASCSHSCWLWHSQAIYCPGTKRLISPQQLGRI